MALDIQQHLVLQFRFLNQFFPLEIEVRGLLGLFAVHINVIHFQSAESFLHVENAEFHHHGHIMDLRDGVQQHFELLDSGGIIRQFLSVNGDIVFDLLEFPDSEGFEHFSVLFQPFVGLILELGNHFRKVHLDEEGVSANGDFFKFLDHGAEDTHFEFHEGGHGILVDHFFHRQLILVVE